MPVLQRIVAVRQLSGYSVRETRRKEIQVLKYTLARQESNRSWRRPQIRSHCDHSPDNLINGLGAWQLYSSGHGQIESHGAVGHVGAEVRSNIGTYTRISCYKSESSREPKQARSQV